MLLCCVCFFFFFKQKTAYEMRISDWSSDVCSSDLLARGLAVLRPAPAESWELADSGTADELIARDRLAGFDPSQGLIRLTLLDCGPREQVLLLSNHHLLLDGWSLPVLLHELAALYEGSPLPPAFAWQRYLAWRERRSEEHTSELQSLMRISYAVFCLKKKKNKHTNQPIPH